MTKITEIEDRSATVAWSPITSHADVIALGGKESKHSGFDSYGGELELFDLGITSPSSTTGQTTPHVIGSIKTTSRFSSIAWAKNKSFNLGLIAGGMDNGTISIYDPAFIVNSYNDSNQTSSSSNEALLSTIDRQKHGAISAMKFNPHPSSPCLLASGSSFGELLISSLDNPSKPTVASPSKVVSSNDGVASSEITSLAWNTEVAHIIASANGNGMTTIWDLRQNKPWCELRCEISGSAVSCVQWNPSQGMHLITSSADDRNPVIKLWDLRASMTMPFASTEGMPGSHEKGILDMDWCPFDESLLVSCGKDNKTLLWDLLLFRPICEIPNDHEHSIGDRQLQQGFGGMGDIPNNPTPAGIGGFNISQHKRYDVKWSPVRRGLLSTCSFDRKVQAHSVLGIASKCGRPPKWMKPASGVSFGFGGSLTSFASSHKSVIVDQYVQKPHLVAAVEEFESSIASGDYAAFSSQKQEAAISSGNDFEAKVWGFMQVIFDPNARVKLLYLLGLDPEKIQHTASEFEEEKKISDATDSSSYPMSSEAEKAVNEALLIGNFEAAVDCCMRSGNLADALILASCGGAELWAKTQAQYLDKEQHKRPFLSIVSAVIHKKLGDFVSSSDPAKWHETLAAICTYGTQEEFVQLCEALGDRLEAVGDLPHASLCYMCSLNLGKASKYWQLQLENASADNPSQDYMALHTFVEKVAIFIIATNDSADIPDDVADILFKYASLVAEQGLFSSAAKYCRSKIQECKELRDRLYRSKDSQECVTALGATPDFPYEFVNVTTAPARPVRKGLSKITTQNGMASNKTAVSNFADNYGTNQQTNYAQTSITGVQQSYAQQSYGQQAGYVQASQQSYVQQPSSTNVQQSYGMQHGYGQTSSVSASQQPHGLDTFAQLPPGWLEYQDPTSGRSYYANTSTGETTWERPVVYEQPTSYVNATNNDLYTNNMNGGGQVNPSKAKTTPSKLASKYGDGFVTSASHPELAAQYGNVGTSNPYSSSARPGTAVVTRQLDKAPVSGTFNIQKLAEVADSTAYKETVDDLLAMVTSLSSLSLQPSEKKQVTEVEKGTAIFSKRLAKADIENEIALKVGQIVSAMKVRDYATANGIHSSLVNSAWKENKDWLKGMKCLIQLSAKRI